MLSSKKLMFLFYFLVAHVHAQDVDFIIFSYDRPLQLYALLESTTAFVDGLQDIFVIYRASNTDVEKGYALVQHDFPDVRYVQQGSRPAQDFKELTMQAFQANPTRYIMFGVDDIVVKDAIDLNHVIALMEQTHAYGFYLRLGRHLDYCYMLNAMQPLPPLQYVEGGLMWQFNQAVADWGYPHTVDMTVYRKKDIAHAVAHLHYINPNTFEGSWAGQASSIMYRKGICYEDTKIVNLPINCVNISGNRHMDFISAQELLDLFLSGKKMDISPLIGVQNKSAHMIYEPTLIAR
jgi:hypothetical protein